MGFEIILAVLAISFVVFVTFFGRLPLLRNTPIASLHNALCVGLPARLRSLDQALTGGRASSKLSRFWHAMLYDRHPTVVIFFLLLLVVCEALYLPSVWPQLSPGHKLAGSVSIVIPYLSLYLASVGDPGYISGHNVEYHLNLYPYDYSIFHPGQECRTCRILKPARSKHCSVCKRCVARSDHHCIFLNKCVGYRNHRWFMVVLLSTAVLTSYGGLLGVSLLSAKIRAQFPDWTLWRGPDMAWSRYFNLWSWAIQDCVQMGAVTLLTILISPLVWVFFLYTLYLVCTGMTTNESLKWLEWKDEIGDGTVYRRAMSTARTKDARFEGAASRWRHDTEQIIIMTSTGQAPTSPNIPGHGPWELVRSLRTVHNLYDLGLVANLIDVFVPDYRFAPRDGLPDNRGSGTKRLVGSVW